MPELKCPNCKARLKVKPGESYIMCDSCKAEFLIKEGAKPKKEPTDTKGVKEAIIENPDTEPPGLDIILEPIKRTELKIHDKFWNMASEVVGDGKPLSLEQKIAVQILMLLVALMIFMLFKGACSDIG